MAELTELGVDADRTALIYSGNDQPDNLADFARVPRSTQPSIAVLGRLVPHKQVELAIDVVADLSAIHPDLVLDVIGTGYWHDEIAAHAQARVRIGCACTDSSTMTRSIGCSPRPGWH